MPSNNNANNGRQGQADALQQPHEKPAVLTSSSSDDGNNSSGDSDEADQDAVMEVANKPEAGTATSISCYRDYSHVQPDPKEAAALNTQNPTTKEPTFPVKLHMILSNPEFQDIIAWLPHGRSWRILQQKAFEDRVIPLYFRHGRYSSFARQVNGWNFRRITGGSDFNSYYHELFLRGMPHLCTRMKRLTAKDIKERKQTDTNAPVPDFYALSRDHPLPENAPVGAQGFTMALTPPAFAASAPPQAMSAAARSQSSAIAEVELAILEKRRAEILQRINMLAAAPQQPPAAPPVQQGLTQQDLLSLQQRLNDANNNSQAPNTTVGPLLSALNNSGQGANLAGLLANLNNQGQASQQQVPAPQQQQTQQLSNIGAILQQLLQQGGAASGVAQGQKAPAQGLSQLLQSFRDGNQAQVQSAPMSQFMMQQTKSEPSSGSESEGNQTSSGPNVVHPIGSSASSQTPMPTAGPASSSSSSSNDSQQQQQALANIAQLLGGANRASNGQPQANNGLGGASLAQLLSGMANQSGSVPASSQPQQIGGNFAQLVGNAASNEALATLQRQLMGGGQGPNLASLLSLNASGQGAYGGSDRRNPSSGGNFQSSN